MLKLLKFSANWCGPCKTLRPIWEDIKNNKGAEFEEIDIDEDPDSAVEFKITSIPTIVYIKDGVEVNRLVGLVRKESIQKFIDELNNEASIES